MLLLAAVFALLAAGFWICCIIDVLITPDAGCRSLAKLTWLVVVGLLPVVGAVAWALAGRPPSRLRPRGRRARAPRRLGDVMPPDAEEALRRHPAGRARAADGPGGDGAGADGRGGLGRPLGPDDDPDFIEQLSLRLRGRDADGDL